MTPTVLDGKTILIANDKTNRDTFTRPFYLVEGNEDAFVIEESGSDGFDPLLSGIFIGWIRGAV